MVSVERFVGVQITAHPSWASTAPKPRVRLQVRINGFRWNPTERSRLDETEYGINPEIMPHKRLPTFEKSLDRETADQLQLPTYPHEYPSVQFTASFSSQLFGLHVFELTIKLDGRNPFSKFYDRKAFVVSMISFAESRRSRLPDWQLPLSLEPWDDRTAKTRKLKSEAWI
jgi:hypothetical protein